METPGERLRAKREERGLTASDLARRVGRSESAVRNQENGINGISAPLAKKYAQALGTTPNYILYGDLAPSAAPAPVEVDVPLLQPIRAGAWLESDDLMQDEPATMPVTLDRRYPYARQWLRPVVGDSMNARGIHDGDTAHIVDFAQAGIALESGKIVEVTRFRAGGSLRETTLKEVEIIPGGVLLWPRSTNAAWKDPVKLDAGDGQDIEVQVTGLLLNAFRRF